MADVARFLTRPPLRCCYADPNSEHRVCGAPASWQRTSGGASAAAFFCDAHRERGDVPIAGEQLLRRVSITCEITFAGASPIPALARMEALSRLELAVDRAGGMLNLHTVCDAVGRHAPPAPPPRETRGRPKGH